MFTVATNNVNSDYVFDEDVTAAYGLALKIELRTDSASPEKFVLDADGRVVARFNPSVEPEDARLVEAVEQALA